MYAHTSIYKYIDVRRIAELCIHVERVIVRGCCFKILNEKLPSTMYDLVTQYVSIYY